MKILRTSTLSACLALLFCAPALRADLIWNWTYSSTNYEGAGTFVTESTLTAGVGITGYRVLSMAGVWDLEIIELLLPPAGYQNNDNLLSESTPQLSLTGLSFYTTEENYNFGYSGSFNFYTAKQPGFTDGPGSFSATLVTPEPATTMSVGATLLGLMLFLRHRSSRRTTPTP